MESNPFSLVRLRSNQLAAAAEGLGRAFFSDPLMEYYLPDPTWRAKLLPSLMLASLRYCHFYGQVYTTPAVQGLACWLSPGQTEMNTWGIIRAGLGVVSLRLGLEALLRIKQVEPIVFRIHKACVPGPHWYLMVLGVEPDCQGQGIGGRLVDSKVKEASELGFPCYLETMTEKNVDFYQHHGFKVAFETDLPAGNLHTWMMVHP